MEAPTAPIELGVFTLTAPLARGGMATVWRAVHTAQRVPVAVKVLTASVMRDPQLVEAMHAEVRAVAGLRHPNVIWVYDAGVVDAEADRASDGALQEGSPWYAMELMLGGTLRQRLPELGFEGAREVLLDLLDALAHAHSRGLLHRDLKPANVLFARGGGLKLSDFGMAFEMARNAGVLKGGTPSWVAPEQAEGTEVRQGPWTDLYAVGCLAWTLACGHKPFRGTARQVLQAHRKAPIPPLVPRFGVPDGFESWVRGLMAKDPAHRPARAADAAWALHALPAPDTDAVASAGAAVRSMASRTTLVFEAEATDPALGPTPAGRSSRPPVPSSWRGPVPSHPHAHLVGAGLGLYGLRTTPLVGRQRERDALWALLHEVERSRLPRAAVLRGPSGVGKSRLAQWLCERAHEVGAASVARATHDPVGGRRGGLAGLVMGCCRAHGVPDHQLFGHVRALLDGAGVEDAEWEAGALRQLIRPVAPEHAADGETVVRFDGPRERHAPALRAVVRHAAGRVAIVWLDDVQWGLDALAFARHVLGVPVPVLLVLTAQDEALAEQEEARAALQALPGPPVTFGLGALSAVERPRLLQGLLPLSERLAQQLDARTAGNALFAVQLVGDWVARGLLVPGAHGFDVRPGAELPLPTTLAQAWSNRVERLLADAPDGWRDALELAAVLGQEVDRAEWAAVAPGFRVPDGLVRTLVRERLVISEPPAAGGRLVLVHAMLREAILAGAEDRGTLRGWHRAAADLLAGAGDHAAGRRAHHLEGCGRHDAAVDAWVEGAVGVARSDWSRQIRLLDRALAALQVLGDPSDPRWATTRCRIAELAVLLNRDLDRAEALARDQELAGGPGTAVLVPCVRSMVAYARGDLATALDLGAQARDACPDEVVWRNMVLGNLGRISNRAGRYEEAAEVYTEALRTGSSRLATGFLNGLCFALCRLGRFGDARDAVERLEAAAAQAHTARGARNALQARANLAHYTGDREGCVEAYRASIELAKRLHAPDFAEHLNIAFELVHLGRPAEARRVLLSVSGRRMDDVERSVYEALSLVIAAHLADWRTVEDAPLGSAPPYGDAELAALVEAAGDRALAAGAGSAGRRALWLAAAHYRAAGAHGEADEAVARAG